MKACVYMVTFSIVLLAASAMAQAATDKEMLGELLYFDETLSINQNQSCASCHDPETAFVDPDRDIPVSEGSPAGLFGDRNAPSAAYAAYSPKFHWNAVEGLYIGGQFWDGRADTLADQAAGPPVNSVEMALPDKATVIERIKFGDPDYPALFLSAYGIDLTTLDLADTDKVNEAYDAMADAIGQFEQTPVFNKFNSKFDYFRAKVFKITVNGILSSKLSTVERRGLELFEGKAQCSLCHVLDEGVAPNGALLPAMFTDFTYDNLGMPRNPKISEVNGKEMPMDKGLGGRPDIAAIDTNGQEIGKFKVMTLRNIELTAPYGHNGVFETLEEIVHFYNTRDVLPACDPLLGANDPGFGETCWPAPEFPETMNTEELGDLGLTLDEEEAVVAFMKTLTDRSDAYPSAYDDFPMAP